MHFSENPRFTCTTAANGEEALHAIDQRQPDVMLLDMLMPKVDGFAVLEEVQKQQYSFPIIVLTNLSKQIDRDRCTKLECVDFYTKSDVEIDDLTAMIEKHV